MDVSEDRDLWVSRNASELLAELLDSIPELLYQRVEDGAGFLPRRSLSGPALNHIVRLIDFFQEWPQLLDPKLDAIAGPLNDAFVKLLSLGAKDFKRLRKSKKPNICFPQALAIILYTLSKVRGAKVIIRFLSNEARHLELILSAFETWTQTTNENSTDYAPLSWEERYILLLWLSHLLLTPFDLSTVSSDSTCGTALHEIEGLEYPIGLPSVCRRIIVIATDNLASASKERESAIIVLVKIALRPDMRRLGLHKALLNWAMSQLMALESSKKTVGYKFMALLSFLAAFVKSAESSVISPLLLPIFNTVEQLGIFQSASSTALTRTAAIKIYSACCVAAISLDEHSDMEDSLTGRILEPVIDELLTALGDNDTPVRQSASKAISVIATKIDPAMAADISEAVIQSLDENVVWEDTGLSFNEDLDVPTSERERNLSLVSPAKWQGLVLTLSQLLFRRSIPVMQLPSILNCLLLALSFEQRSSTGASLGTNVRDAACFGIWAIARKYSTTELLAVEMLAVPAAKERRSEGSIIQLLAIELLVTATLDPAGNIRRGASAALQELIGRHPDTISQGIPLVQVVDYHAIALRSKAMHDVATGAARLDRYYWAAILDELTGWRGLGAQDVESRRLAAETLGELSSFQGAHSLQITRKVLWQSLKALDGGTYQKRQGFLLAVSALVRAASHLGASEQSRVTSFITDAWNCLSEKQIFSAADLANNASHSGLWNEAVMLLVHELTSYGNWTSNHLNQNGLAIEMVFAYIGYALDRREQIVLQHAINALRSLMKSIRHRDRVTWIERTIEQTKQDQLSAGGMKAGHLLALASLYESPGLDITSGNKILEHLVVATTESKTFDTRVVALQGLTKLVSETAINLPIPPSLITALEMALQDYTTDQRGDVGSLLRLEATNTVRAAFERGSLQMTDRGEHLLHLVCTLAGEKLDKVRARAWACLTTCWDIGDSVESNSPTYQVASVDQSVEPVKENSITENNSSVSYYRQLTNLMRHDSLKDCVFQGLIISTGSGSGTVLVASRQALAEWLHSGLSDKDLEDLGRCLEKLIHDFLGHDRVLVPTLETLTFILQSNVFTGQTAILLRWRKLFALVQKSHFKTTNMTKLLSAIDVYGELGMSEIVRSDVLKKLTNLLMHPFPRVRNAAADTLFTLTQEEALKPTDWAGSIRLIKQPLSNVKEALGIVA